VQEEMTSDLGAYYGGHRRADAQTSCDSAGSSVTGHDRTQPLLITGDKTRDAALGEPRIRAGEIIGWRIWRICNGLLYSAVVSYTWHPGVFERSSIKKGGYHNHNPGYHAFRQKEQAEREGPSLVFSSPAVIGSVAMWGEIIEHRHGWRSEYAAVQSITEIIGSISSWDKQWMLQELREKYCCSGVTEL
jgi:hypothetical protein